MARRRRRRDDGLVVSLFPFLSVLACVIGTLTLLLAVIAIQRLGGQSLAQVRLAAQLDALRGSIAAGEARLVELEAQLRESAERAREQAELGARLSALGLSLDIPLEELAGITNRVEEVRALDERARGMGLEQAALAEQAAARKEELAQRRAAQTRAAVVIDPTGFDPGFTPYLVECTADYIELYDVKDGESFRIPKSEIRLSEQYGRYLRWLKSISGSVVVFMIRPDAVDTCNKAATQARILGVRHAQLPLPGQGEIDFSRMRGES
jgi:hypothetical protein